MFVSTRTVLAALMACLLSTFQHASAQSEGPTSPKANGRIYVATIYRVEHPIGADSAIIAIDPSTGDWQIIIEKDASAGGAGEAVRLSPDGRTLAFWRHGDGIWKCESEGQFPTKIFSTPETEAEMKKLLLTARKAQLETEKVDRTDFLTTGHALFAILFALLGGAITRRCWSRAKDRGDVGPRTH